MESRVSASSSSGAAVTEVDDRVRRPFKYASWFSRCFFLWATPLLAQGNKRPLATEDLWGLRDSECAADAGSRLTAAWEREVAAKGRQHASLLRAVISTWGPHYVTPIALSTVFLALGCVSSAVFMRSIVRWFEDQDGSTSYVVGLAFALTLCEMGKVRWFCVFKSGVLFCYRGLHVNGDELSRLACCGLTAQSIMLNQMWHNNLVGTSGVA